MAMKIALVALLAILLVQVFAAPAIALNIGLRDTYAPRREEPAMALALGFKKTTMPASILRICSQTLLDCITKFRNSGEATFSGNNCSVSAMVNEIYAVIEAALWAGRLIP
ncbi:hypothetical protein H6P81_003102 [Aristolochia fimbriata]|uniref:Uncharacterized protein n=1 Tax=Aristolochia fimbriata TaxID=158543 RepID=A0AAV7FC72_ARIFI|nr:hypothetical protein H6P81_003102 [Aristolochia fimbriata]